MVRKTIAAHILRSGEHLSFEALRARAIEAERSRIATRPSTMGSSDPLKHRNPVGIVMRRRLPPAPDQAVSGLAASSRPSERGCGAPSDRHGPPAAPRTKRRLGST